MKKCVFFSQLMLAAMTFATAQTVVFSDNFDSYTVGSYLAQSNPAWTTWNNAPGSAEDGVISNAQSASPANSLLISGSNDQVYPFGNYTNGHYTVSFNMYVPSSGNGAYFNVQHVLLQQWAYDCFFYSSGNGYLQVGGSNYDFNSPADAWFPVVLDVDLDQDLAILTINNELVHSWPFHYITTATSGGTNQLAGIDLFANSPNSTPGTYYIDDFTVTEISAALFGNFVVATDSINLTAEPGSTATCTVELSNPGNGSTDFRIVPIYDNPNPNTASTGEVEMQYYQGNPATFVGWPNGEHYIEMAICIPAESLQQHIGKTLNEVHVYMKNVSSPAEVFIYEMGNPILPPGPGNVVSMQTFTPDTGWNSIPLTYPHLIDGSDLWISVGFEQPAGEYCVPLDGHQANDYSCWYRNGSTWTNRFIGREYDWNLCLGGTIDGTPITPWMTVTPSEGSIDAGATTNVTVTVNTNGMALDETYTATLLCYSSDVNNNYVPVPVSLSVTNVSVNELNQIEVNVYPNPATDYVQVLSDVVERVEIHNMLGQKVFDNSYRDSHVVIPTSGMTPGTYFVTVTTNGAQVTKQVIVR